MPVLNPEHLLEQAVRLATPPGGGALRQADLKRAISNTYYAVFHEILTGAADDFVGGTKRHTPRYKLVYRSVNHTSLRKLCEDVIKPNLAAKYSDYLPITGVGPDINAVATALVDLQEKRHSADYDPLFTVRMSDALLAIATARSALVRFKAASATRRKPFLSLVVFSPR